MTLPPWAAEWPQILLAALALLLSTGDGALLRAVSKQDDRSRERAAALGGRQSEDHWVEYPGWGSISAYSDVFVYPCNVDEFVLTLASGQGYYTDPGVPGDMHNPHGGLCRSIDAGSVDMLRQEYGTPAWTVTGVEKTVLPALTPSPTSSPGTPTSSPTPSPTSFWVEFPGSGSLDYYSDPAVHPCNVDEFIANLSDGVGYYIETAAPDGWCRVVTDVEAVRQQVDTAEWTGSDTGKTYLPTLTSSPTSYAPDSPTPLPTSYPTPAPTSYPTPDPTSYPTASPTLEGWVEFPGWGTLANYDDPPTFPCNVAEFVTTLADGMGYYYDPNVPGGLCRSISVDNVDLLRQENGTSEWTDQRWRSGWTDHISGSTYLPTLPSTPAPTASPTAATWVDYAGWGTVSSFYGPEEVPCNVHEFIATLTAGMGYYYDPGVDGGLCRRISAGSVEMLRQEVGTPAWTDHGTGKTYLPMLAPSPTASPTAVSPTVAHVSPPTGQLSVSGTGDPHLVNVHGQRFDLYQPGVHPLVRIPRSTSRKAALLVLARATRLGAGCKELYFTEVNITGTWSRRHRNLTWVAGGVETGRPRWMTFHQVGVKVVHGRTLLDTRYLNVLVRGLNKAKYAIGGLLGEDDHTVAATPTRDCTKLTTL